MRRPTPAFALALLALLVALGAPAQAARLIDGKTIRPNSITTRQVKARSLSITDLTPGSVAALTRTPAGGVTGASVRDGSLDGADLAAGSVGGDRLAAGSVGGDRLATGAVFSQLVAGSIGGDRLTPGAVGAGQLAVGGVGTAQLAVSAVTASRIADNSVDSGEVRDGGLAGKDVGRFVGATAITLAPVGGSCSAGTSSSLTGVVGGQSLLDDVIVMTPPLGFPDATVTARPASATTIRVTACAPSGAAPTGETTFSYLSVDTSG